MLQTVLPPFNDTLSTAVEWLQARLRFDPQQAGAPRTTNEWNLAGAPCIHLSPVYSKVYCTRASYLKTSEPCGAGFKAAAKQ